MVKYKLGDKVKLKGKDYILNSPVSTFLSSDLRIYAASKGTSEVSIFRVFDSYYSAKLIEGGYACIIDDWIQHEHA